MNNGTEPRPQYLAYLDYNIVASTGGDRPLPDAAEERAHAIRLKNSGVRFVMSAWTGYELARSKHAAHVNACCDFVEELDPLWIGNPHDIEQQELEAFLRGSTALRTPRVLHTSVAQMMATYGGPVLIGETFRGLVAELRADPNHIETVRKAAGKTPLAILAAREAWQRYDLEPYRSVLDREHLAMILTCPADDPRVTRLMDSLKSVYDACPVVAVEEELSRVRLEDSFTPAESDAADFQHATAPLGYCDAFVTRDGQLRNHCSIAVMRLKLRCQIFGKIAELQIRLE